MREIKFRAWHELGKNNQKGTPSYPGMIYDEKPGDCLHWLSQGQKIVDIMQYTGLKDKNGVEIYEGDILSVRDLYNNNWSKNGAPVIFSHEYVGGWVISYGCQSLTLGTRQNNLKIIGNIHENPELLKEDCDARHIHV